MLKPITPEEAKLAHAEIPPSVIQAFNELIVANLNQGQSVVYQKDVVDKLKRNSFFPGDKFDYNCLNVEEIYREAGWDVEYDKPGYSETYPARFTFSRRKDA